MFYASKWHQFSFRCNKRFFFSEQTTTSSFYCLKMDSQPSFTSLERIPQASSPTKPAMKDSDVGDFKCKRKASWERGETKTVPAAQPRLVVPWTLVLHLDRSTFVVGETGCTEQLPRFSASLVIFQCRWVSRKVSQTEGLRVKDVNRKPTNTEHSHEAALYVAL